MKRTGIMALAFAVASVAAGLAQSGTPDWTWKIQEARQGDGKPLGSLIEPALRASVSLRAKTVCEANAPTRGYQFAELRDDVVAAARETLQPTKDDVYLGYLDTELQEDGAPARTVQFAYVAEFRQNADHASVTLLTKFPARPYPAIAYDQRRRDHATLKPEPEDVLRRILKAAEARYQERPAFADTTCAPKPTLAELGKRTVRQVSAAPKTKWAWTVYEVKGQSLARDDRQNEIAKPFEMTVATLALRQRVDNVGTTQQRKTSYQLKPLLADFVAAAKTLNPKVGTAGGGVNGITVKTDAGLYHIEWFYRAKAGAKEQDFRVIVDDEADESRVAVHVTGPSEEVRQKIIADAQALYSNRPAILDCMNAEQADAPNREVCFPYR